MKTRLFPYSIALFLLMALAVVAYPGSSAFAQDCDDPKTPDIKEECKPKDPGNPPPQDDPNNNPNSANTVITETPTPTATPPKPTETKVPTGTATKPVAAPAGSQPDSADPPALPNPDPAPFAPWLIGLAGILIGLFLGALGGPAIFGGSLFPRAPAPTGGGGTSFGDDESTRFVKWSRGSGAPGEHIKEMSSGSDDESTLFVKLDGNTADLPAHFRMQSTGQVTEVHVRGYEEGHQKEVIGSATTSEVTGPQTHQKSGGPADQDGSENIRRVQAEMYEEEIELKYRKDDP